MFITFKIYNKNKKEISWKKKFYMCFIYVYFWNHEMNNPIYFILNFIHSFHSFSHSLKYLFFYYFSFHWYNKSLFNVVVIIVRAALKPSKKEEEEEAEEEDEKTTNKG